MIKHVGVVIIHWRDEVNLKKLLTGLSESSSEDIKLSVVVVDNHTLEDHEAWKKQFPIADFLFLEHNAGFAKAANLGALTLPAKTDWVLFLNPDCLITPVQIADMVDETLANDWVASSPFFANQNYHQPLPTLGTFLRTYTPLRRLFPVSRGLNNFGRDQSRTLVGGCLLIATDALAKIGGWDERFFLWFEDSDLTRQLVSHQLKYGFVDVAVDHRGGKSISRLDQTEQRELFFRSLNIYAKKWWPTWQTWLVGEYIQTRGWSSLTLPAPRNTGVSMVVPNLNLDLLENFLQKNAGSLKNLTELILVTSALSGEKIWEWKRRLAADKNLPSTRLITLDQNKGFAATVNVGFRAASTEVLGTLNDDVIVSSDVIFTQLATQLLDTNQASPEEIGAISPLVLKPDSTVESAGIEIFPIGKAEPITTPVSNSAYETEAENAAFVLYSAVALHQVGMFSEVFGSYLEDVELSIRLHKASYLQLIDPTQSVTHLGQQTSRGNLAKKRWQDFKNWWLIVLRHWTLKTWLQFGPAILLERARNFNGWLKA